MNLAKEFCDLFKGLERAYGTYDLSKMTIKDGVKRVGKPETVDGMVSPDLWSDHLSGAQGIGIIPIQDDNTCYFGAIDIDTYNINFEDFCQELYTSGLPLVPCRTKSGGIHCYIFLNEPIPAIELREKLNSFAAVLGFGGSEIFPKQNRLLAERGDIGNWINMPYFNLERTDRYSLDEHGQRQNVKDFLARAKAERMSKKEFKAFQANSIGDLTDGPPCLQTLLSNHCAKGGRNEAMFMVGVYLKKKCPTEIENLLDEYNVNYMVPPLSTNEISHITASLKRNEYQYTCTKPPFSQYCDKTTCKLREFGVGTVSGMPELTGLTKFNTQPPIWFVNVGDGERLELATEDLQNQGRFQKRCMEVLNTMPPPIKNIEWQKMIQKLFESVIILEAPMDASPVGMLMEYLERFCVSRVKAKSKEEILLGKPWTDGGKHYFRLMDFMAFLERNRFKEFKGPKIASILREHGGEHEFTKLNGKGVNLWLVPEFNPQEKPFEVQDFTQREVF